MNFNPFINILILNSNYYTGQGCLKLIVTLEAFATVGATRPAACEKLNVRTLRRVQY